MELEPVKSRLREIAGSAAAIKGVEIVHVEIVGSKRNPTLRIFIDKPGGITIDDCSDVSREVEAALDTDELIPTSYVLEISSPGLDRALYSVDDFRKFVGHAAKVRTNIDVDGQRSFSGTIQSVDGDTIGFDDAARGKIEIPYSAVSKANLKVDFAKELKGR